MRFQLKVVLGAVAVMGAVLLWLLFFRTTDERAIEELCRAGAESAQKGDAEGVIALLSASFKNSAGDHAKAAGLIRGQIPQLRGAVEVTSFLAQVEGETATATVGLRGHALGNELWRRTLSLRLRKESGAWKVTSAEVIDR